MSSRLGELSPARLTFGATATALGITLIVSVFPVIPFVYRNPSMHIVLETIEAMIAFVVAYLIFGRYRKDRHAGDLAIVFALGLLAITNLFLSVLPVATLGPRGDSVFVWVPVTARMIGTAVFAGGALLPPDRQVYLRGAGGWLSFSWVVSLVGIGGMLLLGADDLPRAIEPGIAPPSGTSSVIAGHPVLLAAQGASMVLFVVAAVGFTGRAVRTGDQIFKWFAAGSGLAAVARLNYLLFPSLYSDYVHTGDVFRLGFYALLLVGAVTEIRRYWTEAAILEERRRIARDLHDSVAQELVFIASQSRRVARRSSDGEDLTQLAAVADRAVAETRRAIVALTRPLDEPIDQTIAELARELTGRAGVALDLHLDDVTAPAVVREHLVRITWEAITNATRHANADRILVRLCDNDGLLLRIEDDGVGFDDAVRSRIGFGLVSIKERVDSLGGSFDLRSQPGEGTCLEVILPSKKA